MIRLPYIKFFTFYTRYHSKTHVSHPTINQPPLRVRVKIPIRTVELCEPVKNATRLLTPPRICKSIIPKPSEGIYP